MKFILVFYQKKVVFRQKTQKNPQK